MRPALWLDSVAMGLVCIGLCATCLALLVIPQRLAQRAALEGVIALHLDAQGQLRVWNQPIRPRDLAPLLTRAKAPGPQPTTPVLRLIPDAGVPWGVVQQLVSRLENNGLDLELQLP
jgi:biopolymer transport protein ExbD